LLGVVIVVDVDDDVVVAFTLSVALMVPRQTNVERDNFFASDPFCF
jgi:hypothetical protein